MAIIRITYILALASLVLTTVGFNSYAVETRAEWLAITSPKSIQTQPKELVVTGVTITNPGIREINRNISIKLPDNWQSVSGTGDIVVPPNDSIMRLASFFIPQNALADTYAVMLQLKNDSDGTLIEEQQINVTVLPNPAIEITSIGQAINSALAGEDYSLEFKIENIGNVPVSINIAPFHNDVGIVNLDCEHLSLDVNEFAFVPLEISLNSNVYRVSNAIFGFETHVMPVNDNAEPIIQRTSQKIIVYPRDSGNFDEYFELPGKVKFKTVVDNRDGVDCDGQVEISLIGPLDQNESSSLDLLYVGPERERSMIFLTNDEHIHLRYEDEDYGIFLGDGHYILTPLLDNPKSGRGIKFDTNFDVFSLETFYAHSNRYPDDEDNIGISLGLNPSDNQKISVNLLLADTDTQRLHTPDNRSVVGFRGEFSDGSSYNLDAEYATNVNSDMPGRNNAYRIEWRVNHKDGEFLARHINTSPGFGGYYHDLNITECFGMLPISNKIKLFGNWRNHQRNLTSYTDFISDLSEEYYRLGTSYAPSVSSLLSVEFISATRDNIFESTRYNTKENYFRLAANHRWGDYYINGRFEYGENSDLILQDSRDHINYNGTITWDVSDDFEIAGFIGYRKGHSFDINRGSSTRTGMNFKYDFSDRAYIASGVYIDNVRNSYRRIYIPLTLRHKYENSNQIEIRARHSIIQRNGEDTSDTAVMVEYTVPTSIKLERRDDIAQITGYIRDLENDNQGIPNVLVHTKDRASLTNQDGKYTIKGIKPGEHAITVNLKNIGSNRITIPQTPVKVDVEGGVMLFNIDVTTAATISGRIDAALLPNQSENDDPFEIVVELHSDSGGEFRITNEKGGFNFESLPPGHYVLIIDESKLPRHYKFDQSYYEFDLQPGDAITVKPQVVEAKINVKIIKEGGELSVAD